MRILLAVDGSESADRARRFVATLPLPEGSLVRVVGVQQPFADVLALSWATVGDAPQVAETEEEAETRAHRDAIRSAERALARDGLAVEGFLLRGRPASAIVDEAVAMEADLVVVGSRGHGPIETMLLGSTAAEVVDHAPCPVLVVRGEALGPVALADDGSPTARAAEAVVAGWPMFAGVPVTVVAVAEVAIPMATGFTPGLYDEVLGSYTKAVEEARADRREEADATAARLRDAGVAADAVLLEGDPAGELVRFAGERGTGTLVLGTRGLTGLTRLVLGSTARNVLLHAPCSVLVVRGPRGT